MLQIDNFSEALQTLKAQGWVITSYTRYDPTDIVGITPSGKAFTLHAEDDEVTLTIAGNSRSINTAKANWLQGTDTVNFMLTAHQNLPANQR